MIRPLSISIAVLLFLVFCGLGVKRLQFQTDILEVLPEELGAVQALKDFSKHFAKERQMVVLLKSGGGWPGDDDEAGEDVEEEDAEALAQFLRVKFPDSDVMYRSSFEDDADIFAASVARIWSYAPPSQLDGVARLFEDEKALDAHLLQVKEALQNSFDQEEAMTFAYDPIGFLQDPTIQSLMDTEMSYASDDGKLRILLISRKHETDIGYQADAEWVADVREQLDQWRAQKRLDGQSFTYGLTGGPVFNAEIGSGMENDMKGTITMTSLLIAGLFLLMQRDGKQLVLISLLLACTFYITLGVAGWLIGSLNLVSVGFAAILLGLVIDYAVVIARESHVTCEVAGLRKLVAPSILWAALSTAIVFGVLMLSTFTGVRQLGALVVIGLLVGAVVMLAATPWYFAKFPAGPVRRMKSPIFLSSKRAWILMVVVLLGSGGVFLLKGAPQVNFDLKMVEPESSEAARSFEIIQKEFSAWSNHNAILLTSSDSLEALKEKAERARGVLGDLQNKSEIISSRWPLGLIPDPLAYRENRANLKRLVAAQSRVFTRVKSAGFSESGLSLDRRILAAMQQQIDAGESLTTASSNDELIGLFFDQNDDGRYFFSGRMLVSGDLTPERAKVFEPLSGAGVEVTGWSLLQVILLPHVKRDFYIIFIPAAVILLMALILVFRNGKDAMLAVAVLATSLIAINAFVVISGQKWNFLSGMALPLIVGAGIDYSIHLIFALRRLNGEVEPVWNGVGKAICFCGISTAIGFSSLLFASNKMLQSMGLLCSVGVLITMTLSILVLPGLRSR